MGRIGLALAKQAHYGLGMSIVYSSRVERSEQELQGLPAKHCPLDELLAACDFVSLHCPATPQTRHLINSDTLSKMKPTALLINTARGDVVDETALAAALSAKRLGGAGLDVFQGEPDIHPDILSAPNTVLLPHLGSATVETRTAMGLKVVENARAFFAGDDLIDPVI